MSVSVEREKTLPRAAADRFTTNSDEFMIFCPACKAFETVWFNDGKLNQNRKFTQFGSHIYHDCGSNAPCRLYMTT